MSALPVAYDDWNMLIYFWSEKGDVTRWCGWEEFSKKPEAQPLVDALARREAAETTVDLILKGMQP